MVWFKVDDKLHEHPKARRAGLTAMGLWAMAGSWASDNIELYNGFVPDTVCARWGTNYRSLARKLVTAGLWEPGEVDGEPGWWFHDWKDRNPTAADVIARRNADAERQRRGRERQRNTSGDRHGVTASVTPDVTDAVTPTVTGTGVTAVHVTPVPTRPDPTRPELLTSGGQRRETLNPADARCTTHQNTPEPPNCRGCMTARETAERTLDQAKRAALAAREACPDCHGTGWREDAEGNPAGKCDHRRSA